MRLPGAVLILAAAAAGAMPVRAEGVRPGSVVVDEALCRVQPAAGAVVAEAEAWRARVACQRARAAFAELLGGAAPAVRLVLWDRPGYRTGVQGDTAVVYWPVEGARAFRADPAMLPHEITHVLLAARYYGAADAAAGAYGTPLPDWFEEAVAIWAEPAGQRARRVADARTLPPERRDLADILASEHPAATSAAVLPTRDGAPIPADAALWEFYPRSIALLSFVHERGGRAAVRALAERFRADPRDARGLAGLPGLPADAAAVRRAWDGWMASGHADDR